MDSAQKEKSVVVGAAAHEVAIPDDVLAEAQELARGAEILPEGVQGLAKRLAEARRENRKLRVKLGVDPTSTDLHIGHAVVFRKLRRFQEYGHQVIVIIGGFTAQIGDPSGRNATRPTLTAEAVAANAKTYLDQMGAVLDLSKCEVVNNADWLSKMNLTNMLRLTGLVTVNQLLAKEAFGNRFEQQQPVGMHELMYPLLQGYDSVEIRSDVEVGGTDQRFNILQGRELQPHYGIKSPQLALLTRLLEGTDGVQKMSKSYNNYIGLKEAPTDMFGKCMRIPDSLIVKYYELATTFTGEEIDAIDSQLKGGANPKNFKEKLGHQIVLQYHGKEAADHALDEWTKVHSERQLPDDIPVHKISESTMLFRILVDAKMAGGTSEAKRLIAEGAVKVDGQAENDPNFLINPNAGEERIVQVGRRKFARVQKG